MIVFRSFGVTASVCRLTADGSNPRVSRLELIADVHYPAEDQAFELAEDELFVLGDNPPASEEG